MNSILDIALVVIAILAIAWGAWKGFISQLVSIAGLFIGIWGAAKLTPFAATWISDLLSFGPDQKIAVNVVTFIVLLILIVIGCHLLARLIEKGVKKTALGTMNRVFGAVFCLIKIVVLLMALASLAHSGIETANVETPKFLAESQGYSLLYGWANSILPFIKALFANLAS